MTDSPWFRNIDAPYEKEQETRLRKMNPQERRDVLEDMVSTIASHELLELWRTLGDMEGEARDFAFSSGLLSAYVAKGAIKFMRMNGSLMPLYLEAMLLIAEKIRTEVLMASDEFNIPINREIVNDHHARTKD